MRKFLFAILLMSGIPYLSFAFTVSQTIRDTEYVNDLYGFKNIEQTLGNGLTGILTSATFSLKKNNSNIQEIALIMYKFSDDTYWSKPPEETFVVRPAGCLDTTLIPVLETQTDITFTISNYSSVTALSVQCHSGGIPLESDKFYIIRPQPNFSSTLIPVTHYGSNNNTYINGSCFKATTMNPCDSTLDLYFTLEITPVSEVFPPQFYSEVQNTPNWRRLRDNHNLISNTIKTVPNAWVLKVLSTTDSNGNNIDIDGYRWYQVEDKTDGAIGWMAAKKLSDGIVYLDYHANLQTDLENKAAVQLTTSVQRKPVILNAVDTYYTSPNTVDSLYTGGGGKDGRNNFQRFIQGSAFPKELILSIIAQESSIVNFDNEACSGVKDGGIGIMQITSRGFKGLGSGLDNIQRKSDCDAKSGWVGDFSKYYSNAFQGIYANIKDGFRVLQDKYRQKCPKDSFAIQGYTFTCQDIEKILTTWGYNGKVLDPTKNYLRNVGNALSNLASYFSGVSYVNADNLVEKLILANDNRIEFKKFSPVELHVIDSEGRVTGYDGTLIIKDEVPFSRYDLDEGVGVLFFPSSSYRYRVIGTGAGTYKFTVDYTKGGILKAFNAIDIPVVQGEIHEYIIDWDALDRGERGVIVNIDYSGDGTVDRVIVSDNVLTDIEPPQITATQLNTEYIYNSQIQIQFSATDNVSGLANVSATLNNTPIQSGQFINLNRPGVNTFVVTAVDNDGNVSTLTQTFRVTYNFGGFLPPIKADGSGVYNLGRTLPVKFRLTDVNGNSVSTALAHLYVAKISDGILGTDEVPLSTSSADTGNQFRYDPASNQYVYNLSTDTLSAGSWQLKAVLDSGQVAIVVISVR